MNEIERLRCICDGNTRNPDCQSPMHPPKQQPTLLTVASLRQALIDCPSQFDGALVLCNGKPAHTIEIHPDGEQPVLNIKFYTLGVL